MNGSPRSRRWQSLLILLALLVPSPALAGGDWNDEKIAWRSLEEGRAESRETGKPLCLVVFTQWCPHCTNYARVFHDDKIVQLSKDFVMVRLDQDEHRKTTDRYAPDGAYIPRTVFLSPAGEIETTIRARPDRFAYFYDENDPASLARGMEAARSRLTAAKKES